MHLASTELTRTDLQMYCRFVMHEEGPRKLQVASLTGGLCGCAWHSSITLTGFDKKLMAALVSWL